jgi:hypothetical protein
VSENTWIPLHHRSPDESAEDISIGEALEPIDEEGKAGYVFSEGQRTIRAFVCITGPLEGAVALQMFDAEGHAGLGPWTVSPISLPGGQWADLEVSNRLQAFADTKLKVWEKFEQNLSQEFLH